jgi:predicted lactoylglutathione lyase
MGGTAVINPLEDYIFIYGSDFANPDVHIFGGGKFFDVSASLAG